MNIDYYTCYDLPIPYKKLKFYPVTIKDYMPFMAYAECLTLDKNSIPDPNIITMSDLKYLFYLTEQNPDKTPMILWFDRILSLTLKDDKSFENIEQSLKRYAYDENGQAVFFVEGEKYDNRDYKKIRDIIVQQNNLEMPDFNISKEVRDSLEKAREYKRKISGEKPISFEDYLVSLCAVTGWTFEYVYTLTIRKFLKTIRRLDNYIHYKIYLAASMSGMVEFKDKSFIKHWLSNLEDEDKYSDVSMGLEEVQSKVSMESAKNALK